MKRNKKKKFTLIIVIFFVIIALVFFAFYKFKEIKDNSPLELTNTYLEKYQKLDKSILSNISYDYDGVLNDSEKKVYTKAIRRQYEKMSYTIVSENVSKTDATIKAEVTVYDYNSCYNEASQYVDDYAYRFSKDTDKMDYKMSRLLKCNDRVTNELVFKFNKKNSKWKMQELDQDIIRKINGSY